MGFYIPEWMSNQVQDRREEQTTTITIGGCDHNQYVIIRFRFLFIIWFKIQMCLICNKVEITGSLRKPNDDFTME